MYLMNRLIVKWLILGFILMAGQLCHAQFDALPVMGSNTAVASTLVTEDIQNVQIPLKMGGPGFNAVSQFYFLIQYDAAFLQFDGFQPAGISGISATTNANYIYINWSNPSSTINCTSTTVLGYLTFTRIGTGNVPLTFLHGSYVKGLEGNLAVDFVNGMLVQTYELSLEAVPSDAGVLSGAGSYFPGQSVTVQAIPAEGFSFINWTYNGNQVSNNAVFSYIMPDHHTLLQANFMRNSYLLTLHTDPSEGGTVTGSGVYTYGQSVTVQADPSTGYEFVHWLSNGQIVSDDTVYTFTMPAENLDLWAVFDQIAYAVTIDVIPAEGGTTTGAGNYFYNTPVQLKAYPAEGYHFGAWYFNGALVSTNENYYFDMPAAPVQMMAHFDQNIYQIELTVNDTLAGKAIGGGSYHHNSPVTIKAKANDSYQFVAWITDGLVFSYEATYSFLATRDQSIEAVFQQIQDCPVPLALFVNEIGENKARLHWVSPEHIESWDLLWGKMDTDSLITTFLVEAIDTNMLLLDTLSPLTQYGFYVRAHCQDGMVSDWSELSRFTTYNVGVAVTEDAQTVRIYPQPASDRLTIQIPGSWLPAVIHIFDMHGKQYYTFQSSEHSELSIDLNSYPPAMYVVRIITAERFYAKPMIVVR
jgi:hypothetical protein